MNNSVRKDVIEGLGGIQDTVKPLEVSLRQHEMRPFDIEPTYIEDLIKSKNRSRASHPKNMKPGKGRGRQMDDSGA